MRFLTVAAIVAIGLLGGLWLLINDGDEPVVSDAPPNSAVAVATPDKAPASEPTVTRTPRPRVGPDRPPYPQDSKPSAPTTAPESTDDTVVKAPTIEDALNEQLLVTESQLLECNDKALTAGKKLDGEAAFAFTIARKNGKVTIESTGVEYAPFDGSTSDCLRDTAHAMVFDTLPEGVEAITAYRKVVFEKGALRRQWMTTFAVTRPPPPPP